MSDLSDALYRGITRGRSPRTEGRSVASMIGELAHSLGTTPPTGVSARTWRDMRANPGRGRKAGTVKALRLAQRRARLPLGRQQMLMGTPAVVVAGTVLISDDERERKMLVTGWPGAEHIMRSVLPAWLAGHDTFAAANLSDAISGAIGERVNVRNPEVKIFRTRGEALAYLRT